MSIRFNHPAKGLLPAALACLLSGLALAQQPELVSPFPESAPRDGAAFAPPDPHPPQGGQASGGSALVKPQPSAYAQPPVYTQPPIYAQPQEFLEPAPPEIVYAPYNLPTRFWLRTDLLVWWSRPAPLPAPLLTLGSAADAIPGALGQPGTRVLYGGHSVSLPGAGGLRLEFGMWLDPNQLFSLELGYTGLGRVTRDFSAFSNAGGNPVIARPIINAQTMTEGSYVDSLPGSITGGTDVLNASELQGFEIGGSRQLVQSDQVRWDGIIGLQYWNLTESLEIQDELAGMFRGALTFVGFPISSAHTLTSYDSFRTTNNFWGGLLGTRVIWTPDRWVLSAGAKFALGANQQRTTVYGDTTLTAPSRAETVAAGGVLATTANMGTYQQNVFAVASEVDLNVGYRISPWITLRLGYTFLWLSSVARPGNQVNRVVSPNLVPSDAGYGLAGPNLPAYQFHTSSFWAQGVNFGFDWRF